MIPFDLLDQFQKNNIVLFCGDGISANSGIPTNTELAKELIARLGNSDDDETSSYLPEVVLYYESELGRHSLISYICERIDQKEIEPSSTHQMISILPIKAIITRGSLKLSGK